MEVAGASKVAEADEANKTAEVLKPGKSEDFIYVLKKNGGRITKDVTFLKTG